MEGGYSPISTETLLEIVEVKSPADSSLEILLPNEEIENQFIDFRVNDKFSDLTNNLIIKGSKHEEEINSLYKKGKEIYFVSIENTLDFLPEKEFCINNSHRIIVNATKNRSKLHHKLESLSQLIKPSMDYLRSMFKYNKTIKSFSNILEIGKYEVATQYSVKNIMEIIDNNYDRYNEKGSYIGHMEAKSRLDFYPTNYDFQYASLLDLFNVELKEMKLIKKSTKIWLEENTNFSMETGFTGTKVSTLYRILMNKKRFDYIDEIFTIFPNLIPEGNQIVVADLFAGEGEWLNLYRKLGKNRNFYIVANELEENRFNKIKGRNFNFIKNKAYEELTELPKELINICLFNPPYGEAEGKPLVQHYLEMMLEDKYLAKEAVVVFALRQDDSFAMLETIYKYFSIETGSIFKDTGNEADKLKQICFIGRLRDVPNNMELNYNRIQFEAFEDSFKKIATERSLKEKTMLNNRNESRYKRMLSSDVKFKFDNHSIKENPHLFISDTNGPLWEITKNALSIDTFAGKKVKLPDEPKTPGAIANLIASGLMNGEIKGEHSHCLAAGTTIAKCQTLSEDGKKVIATKKAVQFCYIQSGGKIVRVSSDVLKDDIEIDSEGMVHHV